MSYLRDPAAIYRASFAAIRSEMRLDRLPADLQPVAVRMAHACGMVDIVEDLAFSADVAAAAGQAIAGGTTIFCDCEMVKAGIIARYLPVGTCTEVTLNDPRVPAIAAREGTTRSAAAVSLWRDRLAGAVVVVGNAPTVLFRLLEGLDEGWPKPAAILALPVGFVGAAESKQALADDPRGVPFLTLRGRRGGSAMASAALNALAAGLLEEAEA